VPGGRFEDITPPSQLRQKLCPGQCLRLCPRVLTRIVFGFLVHIAAPSSYSVRADGALDVPAVGAIEPSTQQEDGDEKEHEDEGSKKLGACQVDITTSKFAPYQHYLLEGVTRLGYPHP
jgi:hypothetical protein